MSQKKSVKSETVSSEKSAKAYAEPTISNKLIEDSDELIPSFSDIATLKIERELYPEEVEEIESTFNALTKEWTAVWSFIEKSRKQYELDNSNCITLVEKRLAGTYRYRGDKMSSVFLIIEKVDNIPRGRLVYFNKNTSTVKEEELFKFDL